MMIASGKIATATNLLSSEQADFVNDILEGGKAYDEVAYLVPMETKNKLKP